MILPGLVYRLGSRELGRTAAAGLGLFLAVWPDCLAAAALG